MRFSSGFAFLLILTVSSPAHSAEPGEDIRSEIELIEKQARLSCEGNSSDSSRLKVAEALFDENGYATKALKRLESEVSRATSSINRAEEIVVGPSRKARADSARSSLQETVKRMESAGSESKKESLREETRKAYESYRESMKPLALSEAETAAVLEYRKKLLQEMDQNIKTSERISAALSKAKACHCKSSGNFLCESSESLAARKDQFNAYDEFRKAKEKAIPPAKLDTSSSAGR